MNPVRYQHFLCKRGADPGEVGTTGGEQSGLEMFQKGPFIYRCWDELHQVCLEAQEGSEPCAQQLLRDLGLFSLDRGGSGVT